MEGAPSVELRAFRVYVSVESSAPLREFSGRLVKSLVYVARPELAALHGLRGALSPLHVSPLFKPGRREGELGEMASPVYRLVDRNPVLEPLQLGGEYVFHVGGEASLASRAAEGLERLPKPIALRFGDGIYTFSVEKAVDVTGLVYEKRITGDKVTLYFKSPAKLFNPYAPTKTFKVFPSALDALIAPYLAAKNQQTITHQLAMEAAKTLGLLVETWYSLRTVKPVLVPFKENPEPGVAGKATYIVEAKSEQTLEELSTVLNTAEIYGVGESRVNGFGTTTWKPRGKQ
ncbi:hypothetical protein [Thermofilum pendens]